MIRQEGGHKALRTDDRPILNSFRHDGFTRLVVHVPTNSA